MTSNWTDHMEGPASLFSPGKEIYCNIVRWFTTSVLNRKRGLTKSISRPTLSASNSNFISFRCRGKAKASKSVGNGTAGLISWMLGCGLRLRGKGKRGGPYAVGVTNHRSNPGGNHQWMHEWNESASDRSGITKESMIGSFVISSGSGVTSIYFIPTRVSYEKDWFRDLPTWPIDQEKKYSLWIERPAELFTAFIPQINNTRIDFIFGKPSLLLSPTQQESFVPGLK